MKPRNRVRCSKCRRFRFEGDKCRPCSNTDRFYVPEVDGTLGSYAERINGGPPVDAEGNIVIPDVLP